MESRVDPGGALTLSDALAAALLGNPDLAAFSLEVRAVDARRLQASLRPNPEFSVLAENVGGHPEVSAEDPQITAQVGQPFELGGKRAARLRVAKAQRDLAAWDYEAKRSDVLTQTRRAFAAVLGAQRQAELASEGVEIARRAAESVHLKVEAGDVSPVEETRTNVALSEARVEMGRARRALAASRSILAATWGSSQPRFDSATGTLEGPLDVPPLASLLERMDGNPDLARWRSERDQRRADVGSARSQAVPDLTVQTGYRTLPDSGDHTYVIGVSIPLPIHNRNQGAIREARRREVKATVEQEAARNRVRGALAEAHRAFSVAALELRAFRDEILPGAKAAFESIEEGYRARKFGFLELLDAQRSLAQARARYVESLVALEQARADLERLIGQPLSSQPADEGASH